MKVAYGQEMKEAYCKQWLKAAMSKQNCLLGQKSYATILTRAAHSMTYFDLSKPNLA